MQIQPPYAQPLEVFKNKFTNLTVKEIQLNLQNQRGIINNCSNWNNANSCNGRAKGNANGRPPIKMFQPRRRLAPLVRKELQGLFKPNQKTRFQGQDGISDSTSTRQRGQNLRSELKKKNSHWNQSQNQVVVTQPSKCSDQYRQPRLKSGKGNGHNTFLLNSIIQILKTGEDIGLHLIGNETNTETSYSAKKASVPKRIYLKTEPSQPYNQFSDLGNISRGATTTKSKRGPRVLENDITRLGNHNMIRSRKLYSQEKSRIHHRNHQSQFQKADRSFNLNRADDSLQNVEILTFYNCKKDLKTEENIGNSEENDNQFLFEARK